MEIEQDCEIEICAYCGIIADSIDHLVPRHLLSRAEESMLDLSKIYRLQKWTLPACRECNSAIGGRIFPSIKERRKCAQDYIRKKYKRILEMPEWTEEELMEMGPIAQRDILMELEKKRVLKERLAFRGSVNYAIEISFVYELFRNIAVLNVK